MITGLEAPRETLISIANAIPYPSITLAAASVAVNRRILELTPAEGHPAEHARRLSALSLALFQAGNYKEADLLEREAVSAWRRLSSVCVPGPVARCRPGCRVRTGSDRAGPCLLSCRWG
jgi:hypothetical protein